MVQTQSGFHGRGLAAASNPEGVSHSLSLWLTVYCVSWQQTSLRLVQGGDWQYANLTNPCKTGNAQRNASRSPGP